MKKLFLFALVAFAIGCSKDVGTDEPQTPDQPSEQPEMVTVSFAMKGDITVEETPLSRAAGEDVESKDLYGINVYYDKDLDGKINDVYGYGLFDNVSDMTISLLTGFKYKFICSLVKNGKEKLGQYFATDGRGTSNYQGYCFPFCKSYMSYQENAFNYNIYNYNYYEAPTILENKFILNENSNEYHLTGLGQGYAHEIGLESSVNVKSVPYKNGKSCYFPTTDRYYGEITNYSPREGEVVNIELKRCVFGVKYNVTGISDGSLSFWLSWGRDYDQHYFDEFCKQSDITTDSTIEGNIYTYEDVYSCWKGAMTAEDYSQRFYLILTWKRGNGVSQRLPIQTVSLKRNMMNIINIRLNGGEANNKFNLDIDNTEMGEDNTNLDIDAGGATDTPVDPTE